MTTKKKKNEKVISDDKVEEKNTGVGFPIVGIGASAGGLAAFEAFFSGMPADTEPDMAFVVVQHLAPDHKSILNDLIQRYTRMRVYEVEDGMIVQPNCAYIIPPNRDMAFINGSLQLLEPAAPRGQRLPIDFFFRSLAHDRREQAICIVLSGTGSDGTLGARAVKGEGGMVMAQHPASAEYDGMPRSVIATGLVDYELPPAEMATHLIAYVSHALRRPPQPFAISTPTFDNAVKKILILLRGQTGHDFSQYKRNTVRRRIERRMAVHQIADIANYIKYLQHTPAEIELLFRDLLIGVTNFFRDSDVFKVLEEEVIPKLFSGKNADSVIRVWAAGCSTGEEAYSIAILLAERLGAMKQNFKVQIFATDIDNQAIAVARAGIYPASITADISADRLSRFFTAEPSGTSYRIHKTIRDMLIFCEHNIIKDPPFSRIDLISCRNLLIYMDANLQKKLIPAFHYSLVSEGFLLLGTSETVGEFINLFAQLDRKSKLYKRKEDFNAAGRAAVDRFIPSAFTVDTPQLAVGEKRAAAEKLPLRELSEQTMLQHTAMTGVLVNAGGDIFYLHGRTGMYLEPAQGEADISNIFKMAREGLLCNLTTALHKAAATKEIVHSPGLRVKTNGDFTSVNLTVRPVPLHHTSKQESPLFMVILEPAPLPVGGKASRLAVGSEMDVDSRIAALMQELGARDEYIRTSNEELAASTEELKSSNEEMQSINEELQSTNEELDTSKEELQSVNEELATVNAELQCKVVDLSQVINDMNNLLTGTDIGIVFVDYQMHILCFTSAVTKIINLIQSDIGRPVGHIVSNLLDYNSLAADIKSVLDTLITKELEVQTTDGSWYSLRILPYRTVDNVIAGAVVTFVDKTEIKKSQDTLKKANELLSRMAVIVRDAHDAVIMQDLDGRIMAWNPGAERMYGWTETEALAMNTNERIPKESIDEELKTFNKLTASKVVEPYRARRKAQNGTVLDVLVTATALINESGNVYAVAVTERVVTSNIV